MGFFDVVKTARKKVEEESMKVLVLGNTFTDRANPYPTAELNDWLNKNGYSSCLTEEDTTNDIYMPKNLPSKFMELSQEAEAIVFLLSNVGGVLTELPVVATAYLDKTFFFKLTTDVLGKMVEGWISRDCIMRYEYEDKEDLFEKVDNCLKEHKLTIRFKKTLKEGLT